MAKTFFCGLGPQKYEWGAPRFLQSSIAIPSHNISHVRRFEERILKKESRPERQLSLLSPSPWERDGVRLLLLHQELHNHFGGVGNRGAGTEDGSDFGKGGVAAQIRAQGTQGWLRKGG